MRIWLFLHLLGFTLWIGGGWAVMFAGIAARREGREGLGTVARAQAAVHRTVIGPGALLTVLSGLLLTFMVTGNSGELRGSNTWLAVMQGAGLIGALLTLFISLPTAVKLGRLDPAGEGAAYFDELRSRQKIVASISGTLGLVALISGAMLG
ncbi:MAG: hypothetical protein H0W67_09560 [Gemmatimonadales bacterium]|nr:hypothetical protein [Gemmatimonadales bacterium]